MPRLSVVVPMHNVGAFAESTLRSLANNAHPDVEFLLVDDCSTDSTPGSSTAGRRGIRAPR